MFCKSMQKLLVVVGATLVSVPAGAQIQPYVVSTFFPAEVNPQWDAPTGVAFDGNNLIIANGAWTSEFMEFTRSGDFVRAFDPPGIAPGDITWDGTSLWYHDGFDNLIREVDRNGNELRSFTPPNTSDTRLGLAWDGQHLWSVDEMTTQITVFDVSGPTWPPPVVRTFPAPAPETLALAWDGQHMWAGTLFGDLYQLTREGSVVAGPFRLPDVSRIYGLAFDGRFLYSTDPLTDLVRQIAISAGDADQDGVRDGQDVCSATPAGDPVDAQGCSVADRCPCLSTGRKGDHVSCVAQVSKQYLRAGILTKAQRQAAIVKAAQSMCRR